MEFHRSILARDRASGDQVKMENKEDELRRKVKLQSENELGDGVAWFRGGLIGKGSYGSVYMATLKKPRSRYGSFPSIMAVKSAEVSASGSIQKEREILGKMIGCPHLIRCFGEETTTGKNGEIVYNLLLEYCSGGTLANLIKKSGGNGLSEFEVRRYTRSILLGLNHIHELGHAHCDLKPENILLVPNTNMREGGTRFNVKICDFGFAKRVKQTKKRKLDPYWRGTTMYLSPEIVIDGVQEAPSDIWALGCIVLEMITGKPPWGISDTKSLLHRIGEGHELPKVRNEISKEGRDFLKGCFVRKPAYRLTADMLLNHPFVEGLIDDVQFEGSEEITDINEVSFSILSDIEDEGLSSCSFSDDWSLMSEEDSFCFSSEENGEGVDCALDCNFAKEGISEFQESRDITTSSIGAVSNHHLNKTAPSQKPSSTMQQFSVSFTIAT